MLLERSPFCRAVLLSLCCCASAAALEPAGGPAERLEEPTIEEPDASVVDKAWYDDVVASGEGSARALGTPNLGMVGTALTLLCALGGAALWLRKRRAALSPLPEAEARLKVLASSRVGPKAFAVTASVGGRVMLLGVTDHNVSHLAWLDAPPPPAPAFDPVTVEDVDEDDLPDDYPGSALRAAARASGVPPSEGARWGTSEANLRRFQEVLRDAARRHPGAEPDPGEPSDPASVLAEQTRDLLGGELPAPVEPRAASLRRKRNKKHLPATPAAADNEPEVEGQVAGLKALRKT